MLAELDANTKELPSWQSRLKLGRELQASMPDRTLAFVGNISHALPPAARVQLAEHTVPPGAYEGRMPWVGASYALPKPPLVIMQEKPYEQELALLSEICDAAGIQTPKVVVTDSFAYSIDAVKTRLNGQGDRQNIFWHPFIGSGEFGSGSDTLPNARVFNNKAGMRNLMRANNMEVNVPAGTEIFCEDGESLATMTGKLTSAIAESPCEVVRLKLAETASGMCTVKVSATRFKTDREYQLHVDHLIQSMFEYKGQVFLGDVVLEEQIDFGGEKGYGDFGARGYTLPNGQFIPLSLGRVVSTSDGVYQGMVMAPLENPSAIGLDYARTKQIVETMKNLADLSYTQGYWGPVNLDLFVHQSETKPPLVHDFNYRDGGSSASGAFATVIGRGRPTLDMDIKLARHNPLDENEANELIARLWNNGILPYATTFMRHPNHSDGKGIVYAMKTMVPLSGTIDTDAVAREKIAEYVGQLNHMNLGTFYVE
jgi:hypothetical protein